MKQTRIAFGMETGLDHYTIVLYVRKLFA